MVQSIFEEMGGRYERQGEYILPCLTIPPEKEQSIDLFGRRHLDYLREYRKITYTNLLTSGRLNAYLADIDRQAQEHFERLIEGMKQAQGITECLIPAWAKRLSYMKSKGAGNKAHLQPVTHFLVHIGIGIARVVFQRAGTKFRYVTLVVLQDRAHGGCVAVCRCGNDRERQQIFRLPNGIHHLLFPPNTV